MPRKVRRTSKMAPSEKIAEAEAANTPEAALPKGVKASKTPQAYQEMLERNRVRKRERYEIYKAARKAAKRGITPLGHEVTSATPMIQQIVAPGEKKIRAATVTETMRFSAAQARYYLSDKRFNVVPAGRRSGKTAIAKRRLRKKALTWCGPPGYRFIFGAPTHTQAKTIYWRDAKAMIPKYALARRPSESELSIELLNGAVIQVMGFDKPERVEGAPVAHIVFDEYGNMHEVVWEEHARPTLTDSQGTADFIGVPEGRNHYYRLALKAQEDIAKLGSESEWGFHTWFTSEVLPLYLGQAIADREIASAKATMDILTYQQEYEAAFVSFEGRAYYAFERDIHARERVMYDPEKDLLLCFDFNRAPGVAAIAQVLEYKGRNPRVSDDIIGFIDEVWIPKNSNTERVCRKILDTYANHPGLVFIYGDATGGAKTSQAVAGSDWDIVRNILKPVFRDRLKERVPLRNPPERVRVNSFNSKLQTADGRIHLLVDPKNCPHLVTDLEGVEVVPGTAGEIFKDPKSQLTHISDAAGYMIVQKFPLGSMVGFNVNQFIDGKYDKVIDDEIEQSEEFEE